jgi:hypothetical protein
MVNSNYTKVNIGDKEVGLLFGLHHVKEFELLLLPNLDVYFDKNQLLTEAGISQLIYTANLNARFDNPNEKAVTTDEIYRWILNGRTDNAIKTQVVDVVKLWYASQEVKDWLVDLKKKTVTIEKAIEKSQQPKTLKNGLKKSKPGSGPKGSVQKK